MKNNSKRNDQRYLALATKSLLAISISLTTLACSEASNPSASDPAKQTQEQTQEQTQAIETVSTEASEEGAKAQNVKDTAIASTASEDSRYEEESRYAKDSSDRTETTDPAEAAYIAERDRLLAETDQLLDEIEAEIANGALSGNSDMSDRPVLQESPSLRFLEADATYREQFFTEALYAKLMDENAACSFEPNCNVAYLFKDVIFRISGMNNGSSEVYVTPHDLVSRSLAMTYAQILDRYSVIDFERPPEIGDNREGPSNGEAYVGRASYGQKTFHNSGYVNVIQMELWNDSQTVQAIKLVTYET